MGPPGFNGSKGEDGPKGEKGEPGFRGDQGTNVSFNSRIFLNKNSWHTD